MEYANRIKSAIKQLLFLDSRVKYSLLYRASQAFVGLGTVVFVTHWFRPEEQGYYYTFASLLSLQIFFELGLSFVILQFTGHEFSVLNWSANKTLQGPSLNLQTFKVFVAQCVRIYFYIALIAFFSILAAGLLFISHAHHNDHVAWALPLACLCFATALNILPLPFLAVIEGSGLIVEVNQFRSIQNTAGAIIMWIAMVAGCGLFSIALDILACFAITTIWLIINFKELLQDTFTAMRLPEVKSSAKWKNEIWPMQWRVAISWLSGYFLSQIYVPILFYYHGSIAAGKLGISLSVCNMLSLLAITFITAYNPAMCQLIAKQEWWPLRTLYFKTFTHALIITIIVILGVMLSMHLSFLEFITQRFVTPGQMFLLLLTVVITFVIGSSAQFLRAFKIEPFVWVSLIGACINASLALYFGKLYGTQGLCWVYLLVNLIFGLPSSWIIWRRNTTHLWSN